MITNASCLLKKKKPSSVVPGSGNLFSERGVLSDRLSCTHCMVYPLLHSIPLRHLLRHFLLSRLRIFPRILLDLRISIRHAKDHLRSLLNMPSFLRGPYQRLLKSNISKKLIFAIPMHFQNSFRRMFFHIFLRKTFTTKISSINFHHTHISLIRLGS